MPISQHDAINGCLLGGAVGNSIGMPYTGLSRRECRSAARRPLQQRFFRGHGMLGAATDHNVFVLQSLIEAGVDPTAFRNALAWRLRWSLLCLPAGVGIATIKAMIKLWLGFSNGGVASADNRPCMRSALIGVVLCHDDELRWQCVEHSTRLTHSDPKPLAGSQAISEVAARTARGSWVVRPGLSEFANVLESVSEDKGWRRAVSRLQEDCLAPNPLQAALERFGTERGVSENTLHSVPFVLVAWYQYHGDYRAMMEAIARAGGDVETMTAIAGALAGTVVGVEGLPPGWVQDLHDWPHSVSYMRALVQKCEDPAVPASTHFSAVLLPRGLVFLVLVLAQRIRRLVSPHSRKKRSR